MAPEVARSQSNRAALVLAIVGAFVVGWLLYERIFVWAQNDQWGVGALIGIGIAAALGFFKWQGWRSERARRAEERRLGAEGEHAYIAWDDARFRPDRSWIAPVAIVGVLAVFGFVNADSARDHYVWPYCMYGAQSQAQLDGCMSHVTSEEINDLDTQAARFGRGETSECLADSGPFCNDAATWNTLDPRDYE